MTGFGSGSAAVGSGRVVVEIRAVNGRFLDVRTRVGRELSELAPLLESLARERFGRGRYDITARGENVESPRVQLDRDRARSAYRALCELRDELDASQPVPFSMLTALPDLFTGTNERDDRLGEAARGAFDAASQALFAMRDYEGDELARDFAKRLTLVRRLVADLSSRAPEVAAAHKRRMLDRLARLQGPSDAGFDATRLEQEVALLADRSDATEELTRIESHCAQIAGLLNVREPVGRRIEFLLQELSREANTIGAKSADAAMAHAVIDLKTELERMREQVQNVE